MQIDPLLHVMNRLRNNNSFRSGTVYNINMVLEVPVCETPDLNVFFSLRKCKSFELEI